MPFRFLLAALLAQTASVLFAQAAPREESLTPPANVHLAGREQLAHFARAEAFLADEQWEEAVAALQALAENGDTSLSASESETLRGFTRHLPLRDQAHLQLARLHGRAPEALALYRGRVDPLAEAWLRDGLAQRDSQLLERLLEQAFCSSHGDDALLALGELALERGEYQAARRLWEQLSPALRSSPLPELGIASGESWWLAARRWEAGSGKSLEEFEDRLAAAMRAPPASPDWLCYPDTEFPLAAIRARLILLSLLEGDIPRATWELRLFHRLHNGERGRLAGREAVYTETLAAMLAEANAWPTPPAGADVATFAGNHRRAGRPEAEVDAALRPSWKQPILPRPLTADRERIGRGRQRVAEHFRELLSFHPIVHQGRLLLATPNSIRAYDLATGEPAFPRAAEPEREGAAAEIWPAGVAPVQFSPPAEAYSGVPRFTLTTDEAGHLYARVGSPVTASPPGANRLASERTMLIGLDLAAEGRLLPGFPLTLEPDWEFDGPPLVAGGRLYVALRRGPAGRPSLYLACYEAYSPRREVRRLWLSEKICDAQTLNQHAELTHNLLTLHEDTLYFNTHLGAIAAVGARRGDLRWVATYPRTVPALDDLEFAPAHLFRDLAPCLVERGIVVAAPADSNRIFFLEGATGRLCAATPPADLTGGIDAVHLLGVAGDQLLCSGDFLWWINMHTGGVVSKFPQSGSVAPGRVRASPAGYGRGVLTAESVYWPTRQRIYVFEARASKPVPQMLRQPIDLAPRGATGGNLSLGEGRLIVTTADQLIVFPETAAADESQASSP